MDLEDVIRIIELECTELDLPNGATGAIWKNELIQKLEHFNEI